VLVSVCGCCRKSVTQLPSGPEMRLKIGCARGGAAASRTGVALRALCSGYVELRGLAFAIGLCRNILCQE